MSLFFMDKETLVSELVEKSIEEVMARKGYAYFKKGNYNLNIIGIRSDQGRKVTNKFDDYLLVLYYIDGVLQKKLYSITTEPGRYYMKEKLGNPKGTAILVPGQYRGTWMIDKHNGKYDALCQRKPVTVYRDSNKDLVYDLDPKRTDKGLFGINIHRSNPYTTTANVDNYSAGCQVFASPKDFKEFMELCEKQRKLYGNSFTYTLLDEIDLNI